MNKEVGDISANGISFDELFSEACIALHSAALKYDTEQSTVTFGLYAKICIRHRLLDLVSASSSVTESDIDVDSITVTPSLDSRLADAERFELLMQKSKGILSDYEYKVLILHVQGYKTSQIAEALGREPKSVDNAKNRIFKRLRETIGESPTI
jgi:RNA polymerase sporulation-specific sigma factor